MPMRVRSALVLAVLAAGTLLGGWYFGTGPASDEFVAGTKVFPGLAQRLGQAARIEIVAAQATLVLTRQDGRWVLAGAAGGPADQSRVRRLLVDLAELSRTEPRTADAGQYARLGVEDPHQANATAKLLRVLDAMGQPLAELVVGHRRKLLGVERADSLYIRGPSEARAWLAESRLEVPTWDDLMASPQPPAPVPPTR
jgi:hypothetical protein